MMVTRIFLPESIYRIKSIVKSRCYYIFGKIIKDRCGNVSIFIIDIHDTNEQVTSNQQLIGAISNDTNGLNSDYITFEIDEVNSVLELKSISLANFTSDPTPVHIFLYDYKKFVELSQQKDDDQKWCQRQDTISQLLLYIKNNNEYSNKKSIDKYSDRSSKNRLVSFLMSLATFIETKLSFLNSSFLKHFHFWVFNLGKLTQKRYE